MDIIKSCNETIKKRLEDLDKYVEQGASCRALNEATLQSQNIIEAVFTDKDKNLDRILDQQAHIKMIIERDGRIKSLKRMIAEDTQTIEAIRKECARFGLESLKNRQEVMDTQARELEKYQIQQMRSIAEDYQRLQNILEQRKKDIEALKKETELEEKNREKFLEDVKKNLERQLQNRAQLRKEGSNFFERALTDELHNPNHIELGSIDEFEPYGTISQSLKESGGSTSRRGGRGGGVRGRKKGRSNQKSTATAG